MATFFFCGIGGIGMSAIALYLKKSGHLVIGSDRSFDNHQHNAVKTTLEAHGILLVPQDGKGVPEQTDIFVVSSAIEESVPDIKRAKELSLTIKKRAEVLADIFHAHRGIAVAGTSGKTTVTAMIGFVLDRLGKKPLVINGGLLKNYIGRPGIANVVLNSGETCVVEADESDGSIEKYTPYVAVVNNISLDHKEINELQKLFGDFVAKAAGGAVINLDCPHSKMLIGKNPNTVTFSAQNPAAGVYVYDMKARPDGLSYKIDGQDFKLKLPGAFNAVNAAAAIAACSFFGIDKFEAAKVLQEFTGTKRRLDVIGTCNGITVIDDFAHNPGKVAASLSALRDYPGRLLIMFQPHGFSPMRMMGREIMQSFADALSSADRLFIPEIYYAGGTVKRDISSKDLVDYAVSLGVDAEFYQTREEIKYRLTDLAEPGDRIVIMGARDNSLPDFCRQILEGIKNEAA